jgi:hypothetical protein
MVADARKRGGSIPALTNDGQPIVLPDWWYATGPSFTASPSRLDKSAKAPKKSKARKVLTKASKKRQKTLKKAARAGTFGDIDCGKEANAAYGKAARDAGLPRGERMAGLVKLDACAVKRGGLDPLLGKRASKGEKARLEAAVFSPDVRVRAQAMDILFPVGG